MDIDGQHYVFGGDINGIYLYSTEVLDSGSGQFEEGFSLPVATSHHCMVDLQDGFVFLATGEGAGNSAYIINVSDGSYEEVSSIPIASGVLFSAACGLAIDSFGVRTVVYTGGNVGTGSDTASIETFVFEYDQAQIWRSGTPLPHNINLGKAVQFGDSFFIVGGDLDNNFGGPYNDEILQYDVDTEQWISLPQRLDRPDLVTMAFMVPESLIPCNF